MNDLGDSGRDHKDSTDQEEKFWQDVSKKASHKLRARKDKAKGTWYWLGMFGLVGWSIAVPTVIGIVIGVWIDHSWPSRISWTLTLLVLGVGLGSLSAWHWIKQESRSQ